MEAIFSFFENIVSIIGTFISGVIWLVTALPEYYLQVQTMIAYCPPFIQILLGVSWTLIVLFAVFKLL